MGAATKPISLEEEAITLRFQLANAEALIDELTGRLSDAEAEEAAWCFAASRYGEAIRTARSALVAAQGTVSTVALRNSMAAAAEALGRILDPPSEDIGERCAACDGYGWRKDPANRHGAELPCLACDGSGHEPPSEGIGEVQ